MSFLINELNAKDSTVLSLCFFAFFKIKLNTAINRAVGCVLQMCDTFISASVETEEVETSWLRTMWQLRHVTRNKQVQNEDLTEGVIHDFYSNETSKKIMNGSHAAAPKLATQSH